MVEQDLNVEKVEVEIMEVEGKVFVNFAQVIKLLMRSIYSDVPPPPPPDK